MQVSWKRDCRWRSSHGTRISCSDQLPTQTISATDNTLFHVSLPGRKTRKFALSISEIVWVDHWNKLSLRIRISSGPTSRSAFEFRFKSAFERRSRSTFNWNRYPRGEFVLIRRQFITGRVHAKWCSAGHQISGTKWPRVPELTICVPLITAVSVLVLPRAYGSLHFLGRDDFLLILTI